MRITSTGSIGSSGVRRSGTGTSSGKSFSASEASESHSAAALTGTAPLTAIDTILALQGVEDSTNGKSRGAQHGEQLLDLLDEVRDGLLSGGIPRLTLNRLALAVAKRRDSFTDPKLQSVLDEIDLRARVELAKLEQAEKPSA